MRDAEEKELSISLNFFAYHLEFVDVKINGHGIDALNKDFQEDYQNNFATFGLTCGDNYVS